MSGALPCSNVAMACAQAMEARQGRDAQRLDAEHDSAVPAGDAPKVSSPRCLSDIPTHEGRIAELTRRYDHFIALEDQA